MLDDLRTRVGIWAAKWGVDRASSPVHINEVFRSTRVLLAFMPRQPHEVQAAIKAIERLVCVLEIRQLFVVKHAAVPWKSNLEGTVVEWSEEDIGLFLPKRKASHRILQQLRGDGPIDMAIDFSRSFCLPTTYWCVKSRARIRVGFKSAWSRYFLNLEYHPRDAAGPAWEGYRGLVDFILMLGGHSECGRRKTCNSLATK